MFINVENKSDLIANLNNCFGKLVVFYYKCSNCGDLQETYDYLVDSDLFDWINKDDDSMYCEYICTNCGYVENFIDFRNVCYFEIIN